MSEQLGKKIKYICNNSKDGEKFWKGINKLRGIKQPPAPYLLNDNNEKVTSTEDKLQLFHEKWKDVFKITEDENQNFNLQHEYIL